MSLRVLPGLTSSLGWPAALGSCTLHHRPQIPGEPELFALALPEIPEPWIQSLSVDASPARRAAAAGFRKPMDALRCLASEALLLHTAKVVWNFDPEALATVRGAHGKPAFVDHPDHHFNLSHSGPWILCALHNAPVGVDVEQESHRGAEAAEAFLSQDELRRHRQLPGDQRPADFFRLWTLKESLLKAAGTGLSHDPRTISISREGVLATAAPPAPSGTSWVLRPLPMPPGTRGACCFARGSARPAHPLG